MGSYYESLDRVVFFGLSTLVILLIVGTASGSDGVTLFQDDFNTKEPYWDFQEWGTGTATVSDGILFLDLTDESKVGEGSLALVWEGEADYTYRPLHPWLYVSMEMKIRFSDDNKLVSDIGGGVRWWGLLSEWAFAKNELKFLSFSPEAGPLYGFGVVTSTGQSSGYAYMGNITGIDVTEWHTYTIHWEHDNATFLVDLSLIHI